ncbi:MAG: tripartite tricarboxylate transporter substrate binding protein, partial [Firmicutes bacterium]|nr:tripartite tricarboxylate transporter substrate binding protein [Bacillota bacterium]
FPSKNITMIIPFDPGTSSDQSGRMIAQLAEDILGKKIVIVNKPGSAGAVGYEELAKAEPDGYTISFATSTLVTHKLLGNLDFNHNDVAPILTFLLDPSVVAVHADSEINDFEEFVEYAKNNSGTTHGTGAPGGMLHIASLAVEDATGIEFDLVPAGGGGATPALQLAGNHIDSAILSVGESNAQFEAGNIKILAVIAPERVEPYLDVPTMKELGYDVELGTLRGLIAPKGTPDEILSALHDAFKQASETDEWKQFILTQGGSYVYSGLEDCKELLDKQEVVFKKILE